MPVDGKKPKILWVGDREVPLAVRVHPRARHIALVIDGAKGGVRLTLPPGVSVKAGLRFANKHADWLESQLADLPPRIPFAPGARIPLLGQPHVIRHIPEGRGGVWRQEGRVFVSGRPEHLVRRVGDFLKREARETIAPKVHDLAAEIDRKPGRITVRDMKSRWGSCSSDGRLRFNWRLILAPEPILDYVVAHEVAHLVHMDHSRRFWRIVDALCPEADAARTWLAKNGNDLMRYG